MKLSFQNDFKHLQCHLPTKTPIKKQFTISYSWYSKLFYPGSNCSMVESIVCVFYLHHNHDSTRAVLFPWIILFTTGKKLSYRMHWTKLCMKHISFFVMTSLSNTAINLRLLMKIFNCAILPAYGMSDVAKSEYFSYMLTLLSFHLLFIIINYNL